MGVDVIIKKKKNWKSEETTDDGRKKTSLKLKTDLKADN